MIAIWGANGFIGRHLVHEFTSSYENIKLFSRNFDGFPFEIPQTMKVFERDFTQPEDYIKDMKDCNVIILLVTASYAGTFNDNLKQEIIQNIQPYKAFLEALNNNDNMIDHIIFLSSGGTVYGVTDKKSIKENHVTDPISPYGKSKLEIENFLVEHAQNSGCDYTILRIANPIGIWNKRPNLISVAFDAVETSETMTIHGDGSAIRDYFDVKELAQAIKHVVEKLGARNKIFNLASGTGNTVNEVLDIIRDVSGKSLLVEYKDARNFDVPYNVLNCNSIFQDIGWKAEKNIKNTIYDMWKQI